MNELLVVITTGIILVLKCFSFASVPSSGWLNVRYKFVLLVKQNSAAILCVNGIVQDLYTRNLDL